MLNALKRLLLPGTMRAIRDLDAECRRLGEQCRAIEERGRRARTAAAINLILRSSADAFFECDFNGVKVLLPRDTLRTMVHCIEAPVEGPLRVRVETYHANWLRSWLKPGDVFLDVGAATGAMTLPTALDLPGVAIIAFEPNRNTLQILRETLRRNGAAAVEVVEQAVSDQEGGAEFAEHGFDETGQTPWLPETSALCSDMIDRQRVVRTYVVPVTTLDAFFSRRTDGPRVRAVKIDVEGFETRVLRGGRDFLERVRPALAIDIHPDPFGPGLTEPDVRGCLTPLGYRLEKHDHVLLATPPG